MLVSQRLLRFEYLLQVFPGKRPLSELAKLSGFEVEGSSQPS